MEPKNLQDLLRLSHQQQKQKIADEIAESQQKLLTISYDKAAAYTTVIIFGGYAGFFAIWQLTKEYVTKEQALWSALLILFSMFSFVLFEVYKMVHITRANLRQAAVLEDPIVRNDPQQLLAAFQAMERAHTPASKRFIAVWLVVLVFALLGAFGGTGILTYAFIDGLTHEQSISSTEHSSRSSSTSSITRIPNSSATSAPNAMKDTVSINSAASVTSISRSSANTSVNSQQSDVLKIITKK